MTSLYHPSSRSHLSPPSDFFPACGATVVRGGGADRENHTTRGRDEIDSRCDAGDENAARERRNARQDRRLEARGVGRRVRLLRGARHYRSPFAAKSSGSRDECTRTRNTRFRIRASIPDPRRAMRRPRTTKCLAERNFREVKTLREGATANADCEPREMRNLRYEIPTVIVSSFIPRRAPENWSSNYDAGSKKIHGTSTARVRCRSDNGEIEKVYPSSVHVKRRISGILCVINEQCGFKAKPADEECSWTPTRSGEWFYFNEKLRVPILSVIHVFFQTSFIT